MVDTSFKSVLIDLHACNSMHAKTSLRGSCMHARYHECNLSSPESLGFLNQADTKNFFNDVRIDFWVQESDFKTCISGDSSCIWF